MAKSLTQLKKQIAALERQAEALRKKEAQGVIAPMKKAIAHYGLTAKDLGLSGGAGPKAAAEGTGPGKRTGRKAAGRKSVGKPKFRDAAGNTWTGHGRRPQWFIDALASGKSATDLAI